MAFFSLDNLIKDDNYILEGGDEEDEYDALNDETFGGLGDDAGPLDNWEEQHEQFAEITENNKQSERLENAIRDLVLSDDEDEKQWSFGKKNNGDASSFNASLLSSLEQTIKATCLKNEIRKNVQNEPSNAQRMLTLDEIEASVRSHKKQIPPPLQNQGQNLPYGRMPMPMGPHRRPAPPPGLQYPMRVPPGFMRMMHPPPPMRQPFMYPPQQMCNYPGGNYPPMPPYMQQQQQQRGRVPGGFMMPQQQPMPPQYILEQQMRQREEQMQQQRKQLEERSRPQDEYAGLMTNREKYWLLNIQQMQLNTGTPYFDDYYYTVFKERLLKNDKEAAAERVRFQQHSNHRRNQQQQQQQEPTPRVYTPLQFENSLGKVQLGSVTAPRKIIDTDVVTLEKESSEQPTRDTRKIKQLLLELESLYNLLLRAEDLRNPIALANMDKLVEIKFKQRIREMEAASTAEQKQELLQLIKTESTAADSPAENPADIVQRIMTTLMHEDKFAAFLNIRKGKVLLLRVLPLLSPEVFTHANYLDLWTRILLCVPAVGRRDATGDQILPQLHPYFKRFVHTCRMSDVLDIVARLERTPTAAAAATKQENSRGTPLQSRPPLHYVLTNKFGVSALVTMFVRCEYLASSDNANEAQLDDWCLFLGTWADATVCVAAAAAPIELIPRPIFVKHTNRFAQLSADKRRLLADHYAEAN